ncbi:MAG: type II secretion system protein GspE, partial [Myxococcota bacterium]
KELIGTFTPYKGKGCSVCSETGYKGRVACYEVLHASDELKEAILNGASTAELKAEAIRLGMKTLRMSAINKFMEGTTTLEEVTRVSSAD